jgi:hypothetical protein
MQNMLRKIASSLGLGMAAALAGTLFADAQTADQAWLKYRPLIKRLSVPMRVEVKGQSRI